jgi:hypothetical protein
MCRRTGKPSCWLVVAVGAPEGADYAGNRYSDMRETGTRADERLYVPRIVDGLHTGSHVFPVSDRIVAAPVAALWS